MKVDQLYQLITGSDNYSDQRRAVSVLPRYLAMCGVYLPTNWHYADERKKIEIPDDVVPKVMALDYGERATADLRAMGEAMGKIRVEVPSNINVWQHVKGESRLNSAAQSLAEAAQALAGKISAP